MHANHKEPGEEQSANSCFGAEKSRPSLFYCHAISPGHHQGCCRKQNMRRNQKNDVPNVFFLGDNTLKDDIARCPMKHKTIRCVVKAAKQKIKTTDVACETPFSSSSNGASLSGCEATRFAGGTHDTNSGFSHTVSTRSSNTGCVPQ